MKKYIYNLFKYSSLSLFLLVGSSCEKDFLEKNPLDQISSSTFWKTKADFDMALTASYATLQNSIFSTAMPNMDALTDNGYGQHNYNGSQRIVQGDISPSSGGFINDVYNGSYQGITRINIFLQQLSNYQGTDISNDLKARYEAEARFLRGFYYYQLYFFYGSVPLVTEPLTLETQNQPKAPAEKILEQVMSDLNFAITALPTVRYGANNGHAVKSSAEAFKARVLMYVGYDENGQPKPEILTQARDLLSGLMTSGYSLDPVYENVFRYNTQESSPEIMFSIKFLAPDNATAMDQWYGDWLVVSPLQNMVNAYESTDGLPWGVSPLTNPNNPMENRDPRLAKTIFVNAPKFNGKEHLPSNNRPTGYGVAKFLSPDLMPYGYSTQSHQDWVVLRYGEVLLMYAEAQNELVGPDQSVYDAINAIRSRVGMPDVPKGLNKTQMRERIRQERRIELAFEGLRYYDLKRWRTAETVLPQVKDGIIPYKFEKRFYLWPLPQTEIDKSQGVLVQNPDYK
ncbi:MAG: RagB/SusD family nutrient uptake outer membrane protein [Adhaeribacter sp.]